MAGYSKEFLIDAYMHRYIFCPDIPVERIEIMEKNAEACYDKFGKDQFRVYASLDADAIKKYKNSI